MIRSDFLDDSNLDTKANRLINNSLITGSVNDSINASLLLTICTLWADSSLTISNVCLIPLRDNLSKLQISNTSKLPNLASYLKSFK